MIRVGFLYSRLRVEEKLLLKELASRPRVEVLRINDSKNYFDIARLPDNIDVLFERSISYSRGLYVSRIFEAHGIPTVNTSAVAEKCGDKYITSQILTRNNIETPRVLMAFDKETALAATAELGYPCVLKPVVGSWGRLLARVDSAEMAQAVIEHKASLGVQHQVFYIQEYIEKPGRDIRAFVIDNRLVAAIYRSSENWITNTARGGTASNCPLSPELHRICEKTSRAIGGGLLAVDLFETESGFTVNEVNHTMEFRNSIQTTGVNIPRLMVDYVLSQAAASPLRHPLHHKRSTTKTANPAHEKLTKSFVSHRQPRR